LSVASGKLSTELYCERLCRKTKNFLLTLCIFVKNSSNALNIASVAFAGEGGRGIWIEAQKMKRRCSVHKSCATNNHEAEGGQKKVWPGPNEISPSASSSS